MFDAILPELIAILPFALLAMIYLLVLHTPEGNKFNALSGKLKSGIRVSTKSGIIGYVAKINDKTFILETYDGALIEMHINAITETLS